jgi:CheY-like chemotaxis protein
MTILCDRYLSCKGPLGTTKEGFVMQTVLVVEDSKLFRLEKEHTLTKAGYRVITAADGMEALRVAHDSRPDLILLDMMLPKLDGPSVLRALKKDPATAHIPVVVVTGLSKKNEEKLLHDGAAAFVEKERLLNGSEPLLFSIRKILGSGTVAAVVLNKDPQFV